MRDIMEHKEDIHGIESLVETGEICDEDLQAEIEKVIDVMSLSCLLDLIVNICHEKAEHFRTYWQDEQSAKNWDKMARRISRL